MYLAIRSIDHIAAITLSGAWQENSTVCLKLASPIGKSDLVVDIRVVKIARSSFVIIYQRVIIIVPTIG